jgi:intraflagellar transport protein 172
MRRIRYNNKFEFTYTSPSSIVVKSLLDSSSMPLASRFNLEIQKINVYNDQFVVAHTPDSLVMGDLKTRQSSEM